MIGKLIVQSAAVVCKKARSKTFGFSRMRHFSNSSEYDRSVVKSPLSDVVVPSMTIDKYIWQNVDRWPDHTAMICAVTGRAYTYRQLRTLCKKFAASLQKQGFKAGDVLCVMLPNSPEYPIVFLGAIEAGMTVSTMNPLYTHYEMAHQLSDCGAIVLVTYPEALSKLGKAIEIIESNVKKPFPLLTVLADLTEGVEIPRGFVDFKQMISDDVNILDVEGHMNPADVVAMPYSSGTTGLSKGVELTHCNVIANSEQIKNKAFLYVTETTVNHQDVVPSILPFYHIYGMVIGMINSLHCGVKHVTLPKFDPNIFRTILKDHKVTTLYAVPPIVLYLGNHKDITSDHLAHLRVIVSGAGPVGEADIHKVFDKTPNKSLQLKQGYGMTETSAVAMLTPKYIQNFSSVGIPLPSTVVKVVKEDGTVCSVGEHGEICVKGPQVMKAYHNKLEETAKTIDKDGFLHTGDVGYYDQEKKFYIVERIKELIKVKGYQVPPAELEAILRTFPGVMEAAVIGIPDERTGEKPLAFVIQDPGKNVEEEALKKFVEDKVAPYKQLGGVLFTDSIPKNPSGKILRRILRSEYEKKCNS